MSFFHTVLYLTVVKQHLSPPMAPLAMDPWVILEGLCLLPAHDEESSVRSDTIYSNDDKDRISGSTDER